MPRRDVKSVAFAKLDPGSVRADTGSFQWVAVRTKYWLVALMQPVGATSRRASSADIVMRGAPRAGKIVDAAYATTIASAHERRVRVRSVRRSAVVAGAPRAGERPRERESVRGWLHAVVQPFATIVMRVLLWMKATFRVNYGWVLVIFGVAIRLLLWPLNQKAMRTSMQMQRLQPELHRDSEASTRTIRKSSATRW